MKPQISGRKPSPSAPNRQEGFVLLIVLIIVGSLLSVVVIKLALGALIRLENTQESLRGTNSELYADSCLQEALIHLSRDNTYAGGALNLNGGTCTAVVSGAGNNRTVSVVGIWSNMYSYSLKADVTLSPFKIITWDN